MRSPAHRPGSLIPSQVAALTAPLYQFKSLTITAVRMARKARVRLDGQSLVRLPLDAAAYAGFLMGIDGLAGDHCIERRAQVFAGDGNAVPGAAVVELAAVYQLHAVVEEKEIRSAGGAIGAGDFLRFVIDVGEGEAQLAGLRGEALGCIFGVVRGVVAPDGHEADAFAIVIMA